MHSHWTCNCLKKQSEKKKTISVPSVRVGVCDRDNLDNEIASLECVRWCIIASHWSSKTSAPVDNRLRKQQL